MTILSNYRPAAFVHGTFKLLSAGVALLNVGLIGTLTSLLNLSEAVCASVAASSKG